jgi:hypothetical protein
LKLELCIKSIKIMDRRIYETIYLQGAIGIVRFRGSPELERQGGSAPPHARIQAC